MDKSEPNFLPPLRPTARAVIRRRSSLLVQVKAHLDKGRYFTLPGGRQEIGETLQDCVRRECEEEIGAEVDVGQLLHVAEVFKKKADGICHQIEVLFECTVADGYEPRLGPHPDSSQVDTVWANLTKDASMFRPDYASVLLSRQPAYLGVYHV